MGYVVENKQDTVIESVLQTTEKTFVATKGFENLASTANPQKATEVYFQIED